MVVLGGVAFSNERVTPVLYRVAKEAPSRDMVLGTASSVVTMFLSELGTKITKQLRLTSNIKAFVW